ncbi:MAG: hypothetical protein K6F53_05765 [Lachnospiraceae bacterium]|nr:hypothetical protein [Lachnospiraceae bacterium]
MKSISSKTWLVSFAVLVSGALLFVLITVIRIDPFMHYHAPDVSRWFYPLDNERSQNYGIAEFFDYDAVFIGTSMTENTKISEMDALFGTNAVKLPFNGGYYKEIGDALCHAYESHPDIRLIIRGIDMNYIFATDEEMAAVTAENPFYLYDKNPFNDVNYLFNRDVVLKRIPDMIRERRKEGFKPGITSFDRYANWMKGKHFGEHEVCPDGISVLRPHEQIPITEEEKEVIRKDVRENIVSIAREHPDTEFYCFFPPYSAMWWKSRFETGDFERQIEGERIVIEEILECENIRMYSFNLRTDITADLNNYRDLWHHGEWINSVILKDLKAGKGLLTKENYEEYLNREKELYLNFDYEALNRQEDYEDDAKAAEKWAEYEP